MPAEERLSQNFNRISLKLSTLSTGTVLILPFSQSIFFAIDRAIFIDRNSGQSFIAVLLGYRHECTEKQSNNRAQCNSYAILTIINDFWVYEYQHHANDDDWAQKNGTKPNGCLAYNQTIKFKYNLCTSTYM